jgi:hypothetical protein
MTTFGTILRDQEGLKGGRLVEVASKQSPDKNSTSRDLSKGWKKSKGGV